MLCRITVQLSVCFIRDPTLLPTSVAAPPLLACYATAATLKALGFRKSRELSLLAGEKKLQRRMWTQIK